MSDSEVGDIVANGEMNEALVTPPTTNTNEDDFLKSVPLVSANPVNVDSDYESRQFKLKHEDYEVPTAVVEDEEGLSGANVFADEVFNMIGHEDLFDILLQQKEMYIEHALKTLVTYQPRNDQIIQRTPL